MKNSRLETEIINEIKAMLDDRKSLMLSSLDEDGYPHASYTPYALTDNGFYILISQLAVHANNLQRYAKASVLIIEDEVSAEQIFARLRIFYKVDATLINATSPTWQTGINLLAERHGELVTSLSQMSDFKLFKLTPVIGRYIKGFGKAYQIEAGSLTGRMTHVR